MFPWIPPSSFATVPQPSCPSPTDPQIAISDFFPTISLQGKLGVPGLPGYPGRPGPKVRC